MKEISVYDVKSGEIRSILTVYSGASAELQCAEGEDFIEGHYDPQTYRIKDGRPRMRRKRQRLARAKRQAQIDRRLEAKRRLAATDWTQLPDTDLTEDERAKWVAYRKALRALMKSADDPTAPAWPEEPS